MDDLISRQAVLKICRRYWHPTYNPIMEEVEKLPFVRSERKNGKWIKEHWHSDHVRQCSACHVTQTVTTYRGVVNFKFCPYCGADMRGEQDG